MAADGEKADKRQEMVALILHDRYDGGQDPTGEEMVCEGVITLNEHREKSPDELLKRWVREVLLGGKEE